MKRNLLSLFLIVAFAALPAYSAVVRPYPGLTQVRYTCTNKETADFTVDFSTIASNLTDRTKGCIMGNKSWANGGSSVLSDASESFTGTQWYWSDFTTYGYEGEILLDAGTTITIGGCFDDGSACFIDGIEVFNQGAKSGYDKLTPAVSYTATYSGWHPFRAFVWDWLEGKNICRGALAALQWNTNGVTDITKTTSWNKFVCGDDMTFLRTLVKDPSMSYIAVNSYTVSAADNTVTANITFTAPDETTVTICSGVSDCGDSTNGWNTTTEFQIPADCGATNLVFPAVPGADTIFRVYISGSDDAGDFFEWSDSQTVERPASIPTQPAIVLINSAFSTADLSCSIESFGDGYSSVDVSAIIATDADFTQNVTTAAFCTLTETFVTVTNAVSGLAPSTTYYVMLRAVNDGGYFAISDDVSFTTLERPYTYEDGFAVTGEAGSMTAAAEITGVYDGVTVAVSVFVNNVFKQSWALTEPGTCSYTDATLSRNDLIYYTLTTELNGATYPVRIEYSRVLYVSVDGDDANNGLTPSKPKATVQSALDAVTENIERIIVQPGTYTISQAILVTNAVTVIGQGESREDVIFSGAGSDRIMIMSNANAVVSGVTITKGKITDGVGGGIYIYSGLLSNSVVTANNAGSGGNGVFMNNISSAVIADCLITANDKGRAHGAGVYCGGKNALIYRTTITQNRIGGNYHGGAGVYGCTLFDCDIIGNDGTMIGMQNGGGACNSDLYRCRVIGNKAAYSGGGLQSCTAYDCLISGNSNNSSGDLGPAVANSTCYNCTIVENICRDANTPAVNSSSKLYNCIVWNNTTTGGTVTNNYYTTVPIKYTCTSPLPPNGAGNIDFDPCFTDAANGDYTLGNSQCQNTASSGTTEFVKSELRTTDLAGNPRIALGAIDMGCYEKQELTPETITIVIDPLVKVVTPGSPVTLSATLTAASGVEVSFVWDFGDGVTSNAVYIGTGAAQTITAVYSYMSGGEYSVTTSASTSTGATTSKTIPGKINSVCTVAHDYYVSTTGSDINDGLSAEHAKATIRSAAIAAGADGSRIFVEPGIYNVTGEISIANAVTVSGLGESRDDVILTGAGYTRVVTLKNNNAVMRNLTISGVTNMVGVAYISRGVLDNCVLRDCRINNNKALIAPDNNVGVIITNCLISGCIAGDIVSGNYNYQNPILADSTVENCTGTSNNGTVCSGSSLYRCRIINNSTKKYTLVWSRSYDCLITGNKGNSEAVLRDGNSYNCTLTDNTALYTFYGSTHYNALIWGNMNGTNVAGYAGTPKLYNCLIDQETSEATLSNCIIGQDPKIRPDYTLKLDSPCVDSGLWLDTEGNVDTVSFPNADKRTIDLVGNRRVNYEGIDIGCIELFGTPTIIIVR